MNNQLSEQPNYPYLHDNYAFYKYIKKDLDVSSKDLFSVECYKLTDSLTYRVTNSSNKTSLLNNCAGQWETIYIQF
jgi:hypothetical protein